MLHFGTPAKRKGKSMKVAIFCAKEVGLLYVSCLLPDGVTEIFSADNMDFGIEAISKKMGCFYKCFDSAEEAIAEADHVFAIWNGTERRIVETVKTAKRSGTTVMFSLLP